MMSASYKVSEMKNPTRFILSLTAVSCLLALGCRSTYYAFWETFGREKRDLLKSNVEAAREDQQAASEQFKDAYTQLKELYGFEGGELERAYNKFSGEYKQCESRANTVRDRIKKVESIASDLFREWEAEIGQIQTERIRADSRAKLTATRAKFDQLHSSMRKAEESMGPVLVQFHDQVLYLKHNLNAQAIASLKGETSKIEAEVNSLLKDMNAAIAQADAFIKGME
jgi:hypothetical protein